MFWVRKAYWQWLERRKRTVVKVKTSIFERRDFKLNFYAWHTRNHLITVSQSEHDIWKPIHRHRQSLKILKFWSTSTLRRQKKKYLPIMPNSLHCGLVAFFAKITKRNLVDMFRTCETECFKFLQITKKLISF